MGSHVCALQHLRKPSKSTNNALDNLESSLRALCEALR